MNKHILNPVIDPSSPSRFEVPRISFDSSIESFILETQKLGEGLKWNPNSFHCLLSKCGEYFYYGEICYVSLDDPSIVKHGTGINLPFSQHGEITIGLWKNDELVEKHVDDMCLQRLKIVWDSIRRPLYLEYTAGVTLTPPHLVRRKTGIPLFYGESFSPPKCGKRKRSQYMEVCNRNSFLYFIYELNIIYL